MTQNSKSDLRQKIRAALEKVSPAVRLAASLDLCARLEPQLRGAHTILFFAPRPDEPDLWPLLEKMLASKICALPAFDAATQTYSARRVANLETDIATGKFGVREPASSCPEIPLNQFDLVLVPGVAFDLRGNRLGRGKGFYDWLLVGIRGLKCGVAFDEQIVAEVPVAVHDARMDFILTPTRWAKTGS